LIFPVLFFTGEELSSNREVLTRRFSRNFSTESFPVSGSLPPDHPPNMTIVLSPLFLLHANDGEIFRLRFVARIVSLSEDQDDGLPSPPFFTLRAAEGCSQLTLMFILGRRSSAFTGSRGGLEEKRRFLLLREG